MNSQEENWHFWDQPVEEVKGLRAFLAAVALRKQGDEVFDEFVFQLLKAVHEEKQPVHEVATIRLAASRVPGLDPEELSNVDGDDLRQEIARDYKEGVNEQGVFGTPTFLFAGGDAVFLKTAPVAKEGSSRLLEVIRTLSLDMPYTREMKKARPPDKA